MLKNIKVHLKNKNKNINEMSAFTHNLIRISNCANSTMQIKATTNDKKLLAF